MTWFSVSEADSKAHLGTWGHVALRSGPPALLPGCSVLSCQAGVGLLKQRFLRLLPRQEILLSFSQAEVTTGKIKPEDSISKPFILLG